MSNQDATLLAEITALKQENAALKLENGEKTDQVRKIQANWEDWHDKANKKLTARNTEIKDLKAELQQRKAVAPTAAPLRPAGGDQLSSSTINVEKKLAEALVEVEKLRTQNKADLDKYPETSKELDQERQVRKQKNKKHEQKLKEQAALHAKAMKDKDESHAKAIKDKEELHAEAIKRKDEKHKADVTETRKLHEKALEDTIVSHTIESDTKYKALDVERKRLEKSLREKGEEAGRLDDRLRELEQVSNKLKELNSQYGLLWKKMCEILESHPSMYTMPDRKEGQASETSVNLGQAPEPAAERNDKDDSYDHNDKDIEMS